MDILVALALSFALLLFSSLQGYFLAYPLLISMAIFILVLRRRGFAIKSLLRMAVLGAQKSASVIGVLLLIGAVTAAWMAAGTVPAIVYYGVQLINPHYFVLAAFVLTSLVSLLIGTSFGTVSTVGIALMVMASGSGVDRHLIAGAIIAGAYVGDRASPMSSSAHLIATITQTRLYTNIQNMWRTAALPLVLSAVCYGVLSYFNPVAIAEQTFLAELDRLFHIHPVQLLPAAIILVLSLLQVEVKLAMLASIGGAIALALSYLHQSPLSLVRFILFGFSLNEPTPLQPILLGGGVWSMVKVSTIVIISTAFVGIFSGTHSLKAVETLLERTQANFPLSLPSNKGMLSAPRVSGVKRESWARQRFLTTCIIGLCSAAFGCTQTIAILLTRQLMEPQYMGDRSLPADPPIAPNATKYEENEKGHYKLALDLENTVVVLSPLIPWNIAGLVPATILGTDAGFIPFAVFLYLLPLLNLLHLRMNGSPKLRLCN